VQSLRLLSAIASVLLLSCGSMGASTIDTPSLTFDITTGAFNGNLAQFDPSLGTLTGVFLGLTKALDVFTAHVSNSGSGLVSISANFDNGADITLPGVFLANDISLLESGIACAGTNSCSLDLSFNAIGGGVNHIIPSPDTSAYVGIGTVAITIASDATITGFSSVPSGGDAHFASQEISGSVFLEYAYTHAGPVSAPEPASIGLSLFGLAVGFGVYRRRRRS